MVATTSSRCAAVTHTAGDSANTSCSPVCDVLEALNSECVSRYSGNKIYELIDMWSASIDDNERTDLLSSIVLKCIHTEMDLHRNWQKDFKNADQRIQKEYGIKQGLSACQVSDRFQTALSDAAPHLKQVLDDARQGKIGPVFIMDTKNWRSLPGPSASMYSEYVSVAGSAAISVMTLDVYSKQNL